MNQKFSLQVTQRLTLFLICLVLAPLTFAETWKWVDSEGKTHYSDSPPPVDAAREAVVKNPSGVEAAAAGAAEPAKKADLLEKLAEEKKKKQAEEEAKKKEEEK